jgi:hypothetical protein
MKLRSGGMQLKSLRSSSK